MTRDKNSNNLNMDLLKTLMEYKLFFEEYNISSSSIKGLSDEDVKKLESKFDFEFSRNIKTYFNVFGGKKHLKYIDSSMLLSEYGIHNVNNEIVEHLDIVSMDDLKCQIKKLLLDEPKILFIYANNDLEYFKFILEGDEKCSIYLWFEPLKEISKIGNILEIIRTGIYTYLIRNGKHLDSMDDLKDFFQIDWVENLRSIRTKYGEALIDRLRVEFRKTINDWSYHTHEDYEAEFISFLKNKV